MVFSSRLLVAYGLVVTACGCAIVEGGGGLAKAKVEEPPVPSKEQVVIRRAQERWDALLARNFEKAFGYISPAMRATLPFEVFQGRLSGSSWLGAKVESARCEADYCDVSFKLEYFLFPNFPHTGQFEERWIFDGEQWWFFYRG
jgi:hypothetical protein